jgi:hypothetical protein
VLRMPSNVSGRKGQRAKGRTSVGTPPVFTARFNGVFVNSDNALQLQPRALPSVEDVPLTAVSTVSNTAVTGCDCTVPRFSISLPFKVKGSWQGGGGGSVVGSCGAPKRSARIVDTNSLGVKHVLATGGGSRSTGEETLDDSNSPPDLESFSTWATKSSIDTFGVRDANLIVLQICRAGLLVSAIVAFVAAVAPTTIGYMRMATASAGATCIISAMYYKRMVVLRRLPNGMGYLRESNSVVEAMRIANWTVVVGLLTWSALLLRGPFERDDTKAGFILTLSYRDWKRFGPFIMSITALLAIPLWHSFRAATRSGIICGERILFSLLGTVILFTSLMLGTAVFRSITHDGYRCENQHLGPRVSNVTTTGESRIRCSREADERAFASFSCTLWFGYTVLSVVRAALGAIGACRTMDVDVLQDFTAESSETNLLSRTWMWARSSLRSATRFALTHSVDGPRAVSFLHAMADGEGVETFLYHRLMQNERSSASSQPENLLEGGSGTLALSDTRADTKTGDDATDAEEDGIPYPLIGDLHRASVSSMCTQTLDAGFAVIDLFTQGVVAVGCASLSLADTF